MKFSDAMAAGSKTYDGFCQKHGNVLRWVSNRTCQKCTLASAEKWRRDNPEKRATTRRNWDHCNPEKAMLQRARNRAKSIGKEFDLSIKDIIIPDVCPVLGIPLNRHDGNLQTSPSLDRIDNDKGYIRGNIVVVSQLANRIKGNFTLDQIEKVLTFYKALK